MNESDSVTITCGSPEAKPVPTYMAIFRNSILLISVNNQVIVSYTIPRVEKSDVGEYMYEGGNKAGKGSRTGHLIVQCENNSFSLKCLGTHIEIWLDVPETTIVNGSGPIQIRQLQHLVSLQVSLYLSSPG